MSVPQAELVQQHLHQALSSSLFRNAGRQASFLRFVVNRALEEPKAGLKEFEIGMEVYNRGVDYDPRVDPIVRVEAARLRTRLREYYDLEPNSVIRIELPKGGYIPQFVVVAERAPQPAATLQQVFAGNAVTLAVTPFRSLSQDPENQEFCDGLTAELLHQLTQSAILQVIARDKRLPVSEHETVARYLVDGSVRRADKRVRVTVNVMELNSARVIFSNIYQQDLTDVFAVQETISRDAALGITNRLQVATAEK
ncbi:MAG: hypothetical protein V4628_18355 [Pseudomonadota bacterium]